VIKHYKGVCHLYVDAAADPVKALDLLVDGKASRRRMQRAGDVAGASRHRPVFMPLALEVMAKRGVEVRGCARTRTWGDHLRPAEDADYAAEYLDLILRCASSTAWARRSPTSPDTAPTTPR
jgi:glutamate-5-semialdehyde dehydrogenase